MDNVYDINFRCFYPNGNRNDHRRQLSIEEIPKWIDAYKYTHPDCNSITVKVWFDNETDSE